VLIGLSLPSPTRKLIIYIKHFINVLLTWINNMQRA